MRMKKPPVERPFIDLTGPDGNAFVVMSVAKRLSRQLNFNWDDIHKEMMASDYENLVSVFESYFGDYIDIYE